MKASVSALKKFPEFNSSLTPEKDALIYKGYYHLGVAVDTPEGLVVPVIRDVDRKGIMELSQEFGSTSARAREGKLGPADLQGACFTISSLGGIGGTGFTPIVNAPEVAILGVVRSKMAPVWDGSAFSARSCCRSRCPTTTASSTARWPPGSSGTCAGCSKTTGGWCSDRLRR